MSFGRLNKLKIVVQLIALPFAISGGVYLESGDKYGSGFYFLLTLFISLAIAIFFAIPGINSFRVIDRLANDSGEYSILPLFDSGYSIGLENENNWLFFTTPCINASISGLPVNINFTPSSKSRWSYISFNFEPLTKENSKRIFRESISFTLYLKKRLKKDVKPEVLSFVSSLKAQGLSSGAEKEISSLHFGAYK